MYNIHKDMMSVSKGVWNNNEVWEFFRAPAKRGRGFRIWESGIHDVAFSEGEMSLQGQRYDDDDDDVDDTGVDLFVCFVDDRFPALQRILSHDVFFICQKCSSSDRHYLLTDGCNSEASKPDGPRFFGLVPSKRPEHAFGKHGKRVWVYR